VKTSDLQRKIGYSFKQEDFLVQAMTHSSYIREKKLSPVRSNERLEFLGDAFLDAIIGEELYRLMPEATEGVLSKARAHVVCEESLTLLGKSLELGSCLRLGKGEEMTGGRERTSILADGTEALIGAIYLDGGYEAVRPIVLGWLAPRIREAVEGRLRSDYKSALQEMLQKDGEASIQYVLDGEEGPDHDKIFFVTAMVDGEPKGKGRGKSKKEAEQQAAKAAKEAVIRGKKDVL
jgi:ribonuclease-3